MVLVKPAQAGSVAAGRVGIVVRLTGQECQDAQKTLPESHSQKAPGFVRSVLLGAPALFVAGPLFSTVGALCSHKPASIDTTRQ
jgi:hypothetical protein